MSSEIYCLIIVFASPIFFLSPDNSHDYYNRYTVVVVPLYLVGGIAKEPFNKNLRYNTIMGIVRNPNHRVIKALEKKGFTNIELIKPTNNNRYKSMYDTWYCDCDQFSDHLGYSIVEVLSSIKRGNFDKYLEQEEI